MSTYASIGSTGGVSSEIHLATIEGLKILENGGDAFDAAITVSGDPTVSRESDCRPWCVSEDS